MLKDACGRCHNLNRVILQTVEWKLKDWMHAFDKMAKTSHLTKTEKTAVANYVDTHRQEIELERSDRQDKPDTMSIDTYYVLFENRCVVCHEAEMIDRVSEDLDRKDLKHVVDRMVEKAPHFLDGVNKENIADYLHKSKASPEEVAGKRGDM
jgi:mono/diheme cytochrome c family protein